MHIAPGYILVGILTGAVAIFLYIQHDQQVTATQMSMQQTQRCAQARFQVTYQSALSKSGPEARAQLLGSQQRAGRICAEARALRRDLRSGLKASQGAETSVGDATGQFAGLPKQSLHPLPTPPVPITKNDLPGH
jgi:hypothetical protein